MSDPTFPTLISKRKWLESELPLIIILNARLTEINLLIKHNKQQNHELSTSEKFWYRQGLRRTTLFNTSLSCPCSWIFVPSYGPLDSLKDDGRTRVKINWTNFVAWCFGLKWYQTSCVKILNYLSYHTFCRKKDFRANRNWYYSSDISSQYLDDLPKWPEFHKK